MKLPLVISATPVEERGLPVFQHKPSELVTCKVCSAYLTSHCKISGDKWQCSICSNDNTISNKAEMASLQSKYESFELILGKQEEPGPIIVIYLSLGYTDSQFGTVKQQFNTILDCLPDGARTLIFLGSNECEIEILVPPCQLPPDPDLNLSNPFSSTFDISSNCANTAAIAKFASFQECIGLDLATFFFDSTTVDAAKRTVSKINISKNDYATAKSLRIAGTLSNAFGNMPFHFISMVDIITDRANLFQLGERCVRVDFLVMGYGTPAFSLSKVITGTVQLVDPSHAIEQVQTLMSHKTKYEMFAHLRARRASVEWKRLPKPFYEITRQTLRCPVCVTDYQSFAIDVDILPNQDEFVFQMTTKYTQVEKEYICTKLRVTSKLVKTSSNMGEVVASMNPDVVLWYWSDKFGNADKQEVISALFRSVASIISSCRSEINPAFIRAVLSAADWDITSSSRYLSCLANELILFSNPERAHFVPRFSESGMVCQSVNGVEFANEDAREAANALARELPIFKTPKSPITPSFVTEDQSRKQKLFSIIEGKP